MNDGGGMFVGGGALGGGGRIIIGGFDRSGPVAPDDTRERALRSSPTLEIMDSIDGRLS